MADMELDEPYGGTQDPVVLSSSESLILADSEDEAQRQAQPRTADLTLSSDPETETESKSEQAVDEEDEEERIDGAGAQPVLGPPGGLAVRACRKSAAGVGWTSGGARGGAPGGGAGARQKRLTKVTAETAAAAMRGRKSARARMPSQGEQSGKEYEEKTKMRKKDPDLRDLPFPFSIIVHLEELRLSLPQLPAQPHLQLAIVFRDSGNPKSAANPACSSSFPLRLPAQSSSTVAVLSSDDLSAPTRTFTISRLPPAAVDHTKSLATQRRADTRPDLCEILLRVTISDGTSSGPRYVGFISLSSSTELQRRGDGIAKLKLQRIDAPAPGGNAASVSPTKPSRAADPVVAQVAVSWKVKRQKARTSIEEDAAARKWLTDEQLKMTLEDELRRLEQEWRMETVEREERLNRLEASSRPPPPVQTSSPSSAPPPSSLWASPAGATSAAPSTCRLAPTPRYAYISPYPRALPIEDGPLKTFPFIAKANDPGEPIQTWEDSKRANEKAVEKADLFLVYVPEDGDDEDPDVVEYEEQARRDRYLEWEALHAPDPGTVIRDFQALRTLITSLGYTPDELSRIEAAAFDRAKREGLWNEARGTFALLLFGDKEDVLVRALRIFEERTGVSAWLAQSRYLRVVDDPLISVPRVHDPCDFCGDLFCLVHGFDDPKILAFPTPTKQPLAKKQSVSGGCSRCGSSTCLNFVGGTSNDPLDAEAEALVMSSLLEPGAPPLDPCTAALVLGRPVQEDELFRYNSPPASPKLPRPNKPRHSRKKIELPVSTAGYDPCECKDGNCGTSGCSCGERHTWCDRFCACPPTCYRRFPGCDETRCEPGNCFCAENNRECDPQLCSCPDSGCGNSLIRLGRIKRVQVVRSSVKNAGFGLVILEPAKKDDLIGVYGGEFFVQAGEEGIQFPGAEWKSALADTALASYFFNVDGFQDSDAHAIDSEIYGSNMRFTNGTTDESANCAPKVKYVAGTHQIGIYVSRNLKAGEELLMYYGAAYPMTTSAKDDEACAA